MQKPQDLSVTVALVALTPIVASVYDFVYVAHATARTVRNKLRQTESRNLWFGCNLPELGGFPARLWIRSVLVRAQEGQLDVWRCLGLVSGGAVAIGRVDAPDPTCVMLSEQTRQQQGAGHGVAGFDSQSRS
jgi:hypothetical protein